METALINATRSPILVFPHELFRAFPAIPILPPVMSTMKMGS